MIGALNTEIFRDSLLGWFAENQRDLPWRRTYDPYHVWISEIMLQQTQMERGVEYFNRWMQRFPDPESIAKASERDVLKAWEGLGYYSRARNIIKTAALLVEKYDGNIPDSYDELIALPGIGPYTAAAIMSIAFNQPYPVVDANVERLFARFDDVDHSMKDKAVQKELHVVLKEIVNDTVPRDVNQALMELGALVCTPKNPDCPACPVQASCKAFSRGTVTERPVRRRRQEKIDIIMACTIIEHDGKVFIQQRREGDVWGGLWEFPGGRLKNGESADQAALRELYEETELQALNLRPFRTVTHYYTRFRVTLHSFFGQADGTPEPRLHAATRYLWVTMQELEKYPFPSGHRQLIASMTKDNTAGGDTN